MAQNMYNSTIVLPSVSSHLKHKVGSLPQVKLWDLKTGYKYILTLSIQLVGWVQAKC